MAQRLKPDWVLFITVLVMSFFGLVMIYSASIPKAEIGDRNSLYFLMKQFVLMAVGLILLMTLRRTDYRVFKHPFDAGGSVFSRSSSSPVGQNCRISVTAF